MDYDTAIDFYSLIKKEFPDTDELFNKFYNYFETTWLSINNDDVKYDFSLWSYFGKFNYKGNKKQLVSENNLKEYIYFTNNCVESFNHCLNECLNNNNKVSFQKFEEIIKYIFVKMDLAKEKVNTSGYSEKTLVSDILRELINLGFGKNNKIIKVNDLEKLKNKNIKISDIYKLSFENVGSTDWDNDNNENKIDE